VSDYVSIEKINEAFIRIECEPSIAYELGDHFTFEVPGAKFMPAVRNRMWDGKIRLFNVHGKTIYAGLLDQVIEFCRDRDYEVAIDKRLKPEGFTRSETEDLIKRLKLPLVPHEHQIEAEGA
jgi:hypothetical protein